MRIAVDVVGIDAEGHLLARIFELVIQFVDVGRKNPLLPEVIGDLDCYVVFFPPSSPQAAKLANAIPASAIAAINLQKRFVILLILASLCSFISIIPNNNTELYKNCLYFSTKM